MILKCNEYSVSYRRCRKENRGVVADRPVREVARRFGGLSCHRRAPQRANDFSRGVYSRAETRWRPTGLSGGGPHGRICVASLQRMLSGLSRLLKPWLKILCHRGASSFQGASDATESEWATTESSTKFKVTVLS